MGRSPSDEAGRNRERDEAQPWRAWYKTSKWQRLSTAIKVRDNYACQMCGRVCVAKGEAIADHRIPHRGNDAMFWDEDNLWCLCKGCHDGAKQRMDRRR